MKGPDLWWFGPRDKQAKNKKAKEFLDYDALII